ncbi:type IV toxin-antitoxin system AbiEi family antitoxin domain-containing protein [Trueperella pecoris]|uniref:Type IV toxin-antitoxin system AbiEi family antitoxin domain-containing protein n=1 Tax=Trueperella pecoris TaxID=2733571 RepID=A0A7M1QV82_9ACTO|nr:type IV toxin-antitoxin system AbiEi family antitoxin domain-containing protein [Trueperella pecoris]QOQ38444.1 type IV toxin-antitoxin system AbiEi family antitoxin domain-containing protein [Trueperella pecoris]QOR45067.1 type IV toxin-antitoxin system AbiEi family antitoxin domain-containing protein [Trueperella pecoris]QTG74969.1 type IV toxin-antitoxin system AbiEi family antitoxin domain-containing protein [Trueperella pecoris]
MVNMNHSGAIAQLAESEGVFTTAQAKRLGITRDALHDACESGRVVRVMRGAYRMIGSGSSYTDELAAIWKLTSPAKFTHERLVFADWDGIAIGGSTASALLEIGDFHLSPFRIYTPSRFNSRNPSASFAKRRVARHDVMFAHGVLVTRPERTVFDLVVDDEDLSLVAAVLEDAWLSSNDFDFARLELLLQDHFGEDVTADLLQGLLSDAHLSDKAAKR